MAGGTWANRKDHDAGERRAGAIFEKTGFSVKHKLAEGDGDGAIEALNGYFGVKDPDFDEAHRNGVLVKHRKKLLATAPNDIHSLIDTLRTINRLDPSDKAAASALVKAEARLEAHRKAQKRNEGVTVGMTMAEVLESSWGKPASRNVTTHATHEREQWVYGNGNYLYFQDGILRTIQTTR